MLKLNAVWCAHIHFMWHTHQQRIKNGLQNTRTITPQQITNFFLFVFGMRESIFSVYGKLGRAHLVNWTDWISPDVCVAFYDDLTREWEWDLFWVVEFELEHTVFCCFLFSIPFRVWFEEKYQHQFFLLYQYEMFIFFVAGFITQESLLNFYYSKRKHGVMFALSLRFFELKLT